MSGEEVEKFPHIRQQLKKRGFKTFTDFVYAVCEAILEQGFLPHTNIGVMTYDELEQLREVNASMGLMLESTDLWVAKKVQPQKDIKDRVRTIADAGRLKIPYTSGILIGMGESVESRFESLRIIADLQIQYSHIQEIIIQNYVPNSRSRLPAQPISLEEYIELITYSREIMPEVTIQIPPNLNPCWLDLIEVGAEDLGGISPEGDHVNIDSPWEQVILYEKALAKRGYRFSKRLPVYEKYYQTVLSFPGKIGKYLETFINNEQ
jgi:FO synthase subunit 1